MWKRPTTAKCVYVFPILNCRYMCGALPLPLETLFPSHLFALSFCFVFIERLLTHTHTSNLNIVHSKKHASRIINGKQAKHICFNDFRSNCRRAAWIFSTDATRRMGASVCVYGKPRLCVCILRPARHQSKSSNRNDRQWNLGLAKGVPIDDFTIAEYNHTIIFVRLNIWFVYGKLGMEAFEWNSNHYRMACVEINNQITYIIWFSVTMTTHSLRYKIMQLIARNDANAHTNSTCHSSEMTIYKRSAFCCLKQPVSNYWILLIVLLLNATE